MAMVILVAEDVVQDVHHPANSFDLESQVSQDGERLTVLWKYREIGCVDVTGFEGKTNRLSHPPSENYNRHSKSSIFKDLGKSRLDISPTRSL